MSQLPGLPDKYKESTKVSLEECKDRGKFFLALTWGRLFFQAWVIILTRIKTTSNFLGGHADKCEAGYDLAKCIYLSNPEKFFMP